MLEIKNFITKISLQLDKS